MLPWSRDAIIPDGTDSLAAVRMLRTLRRILSGMDLGNTREKDLI